VIAIENVRLFEEIQDKSRQLEEASKHQSQFLANMSHELRTPLNAILGYTELILDSIYGEMPEKARAVLERLQANGRHLRLGDYIRVGCENANPRSRPTIRLPHGRLLRPIVLFKLPWSALFWRLVKVGCGSIASISRCPRYVRSPSKSGIKADIAALRMSARSGHSITSSARSRNDSEIVRPMALAVLRLTTSSNLVGRSIGRSAGFAPFKILST
jgi:His Kinase A (phospho-acceptor) domain